jgi:phosphoenolpyruvate carboxylase
MVMIMLPLTSQDRYQMQCLCYCMILIVFPQVCFFSRWIASDLFYKEIDALLFDLSMFKYTDEIAQLAIAASERRRLHRPKYLTTLYKEFRDGIPEREAYR